MKRLPVAKADRERITEILRAGCSEPPVLVPYWPRDPDVTPIGLDWLDGQPVLSTFEPEELCVEHLPHLVNAQRLWFCRTSRSTAAALGVGIRS